MHLNKFLIKYFLTPLIVLSTSSELYAGGLIDKIKLRDMSSTILKKEPQTRTHPGGIEHVLDVEEYTVLFEKNKIVVSSKGSVVYAEVGRVYILFGDHCSFAKSRPKEEQYLISLFSFHYDQRLERWDFLSREVTDNLMIKRKLYNIFNATKHLYKSEDSKNVVGGSGQQEKGLEQKIKEPTRDDIKSESRNLTIDDVKGAEYILSNGRKLKPATRINEDHENQFGIQISGISRGEINNDGLDDAAIIIYDLKSFKVWLYAVINRNGSSYPIGPQEIKTTGYFHMVSLDVKYNVIRVKFRDSNSIEENIIKYYKLKGNQLVID